MACSKKSTSWALNLSSRDQIKSVRIVLENTILAAPESVLQSTTMMNSKSLVTRSSHIIQLDLIST